QEEVGRAGTEPLADGLVTPTYPPFVTANSQTAFNAASTGSDATESWALPASHSVAPRGSRNLRLRRTGRRLACVLDRRPESEIPAPLPRREAPPRLRSETPHGASAVEIAMKYALWSQSCRRGGACPSRPRHRRPDPSLLRRETPAVTNGA